MKWEVLIKHVCYMLKFKDFLQDIVMGLFELPAELARIFFFFFTKHHIYSEDSLMANFGRSA